MELATNLAPEVQLPQDVTPQFSSLFSYLNQLEEFQQTIIELIPFATDQQLEQTKERGLAMGSAGWRIVAACDAEALARVRRLAGGRGNKDTEGVGRVAAVKERSKATKKCDSQTYRNAQIVNTFGKSILNVQNPLLDDKGYYEAALRADKPKKAIRIFEKEKRDNPNFSVRDAFKLAKELKANKPKDEIPNRDDYLDPHFKSFLLDLENALTTFSNRCPRPEFKIRIDQWTRATRFERARTPQSDYEAVKRQVDQGACTAEEIADEVYLALIEIREFCERLVGCPKPTKDTDPREAGTDYEWRPIGANTEVAKGSRLYGVFRKDAVSGDAFSTYHPTVDWEE